MHAGKILHQLPLDKPVGDLVLLATRDILLFNSDSYRHCLTGCRSLSISLVSLRTQIISIVAVSVICHTS